MVTHPKSDLTRPSLTSVTIDISHSLLLDEDISCLKQDCKDISGLRCMLEPCAFGLSRHLGLLRARQLRKRSFFKGRVRRYSSSDICISYQLFSDASITKILLSGDVQLNPWPSNSPSLGHSTHEVKGQSRSKVNLGHAIGAAMPVRITPRNDIWSQNIKGVHFRNHANFAKLSFVKFHDQHPFSLHLVNSRSIKNKVADLRHYIIDNRVDILVITETWLSSKDDVLINRLTPEGYKFKQQTREGRKGGGVAIISRESIEIAVKHQEITESMEYIDAYVTYENRSFELICIYRPGTNPRNGNPVATSSFFDDLISILDRHDVAPYNLVIVGDFNFHVNDDNDVDASNFLDILTAYDLTQCVKERTHESGHTLATLYNTISRNLIHKHAPEQKNFITVRSRHQGYTNEIREEKRKRRRLERMWRRTKLPVDRENFVIQKEKFRKMLEDADTEFYSSLVMENSGSSQKLFKALKKILKRRDEVVFPQHHSLLQIADEFIEFFTDKIAKIQDDIDKNLTTDDRDCLCYQSEIPKYEFAITSFRDLCETEVESLLKKSTTASCDLDPIPSWVLTHCHTASLKIMTQIINKSLQSADMPKEFKLAILIPLLKKIGLEVIKPNFRPVSNLAYASKLIESAVASQLVEHMTNKGLFEPLQSAYRQGHSTETALLEVQNDMLVAMDSQQVSILILLDLSAAF